MTEESLSLFTKPFTNTANEGRVFDVGGGVLADGAQHTFRDDARVPGDAAALFRRAPRVHVRDARSRGSLRAGARDAAQNAGDGSMDLQRADFAEHRARADARSQ